MREFISVASLISSIVLIVLIPTLLFKTMKRVQELENRVEELENKKD